MKKKIKNKKEGNAPGYGVDSYIKSTTNIKKILIYLVIFWAIAVLALYLYLHYSGSDYIFVLDGEEVKEISECRPVWNYTDLQFIPCLYNGEKNVIFGPDINWSLSPEENCGRYNATFPGFNLKNQTKNFEIYSQYYAGQECKTISVKDINEQWLEKCVCNKIKIGEIETDLLAEEWGKDCVEYQCSENLIVLKK